MTADAKPFAVPHALDPARLAQANISRSTLLATDYLNRFNEPVMLLDLLATAPDCIEDLLAWRPATYREHFGQSVQGHRELVIAAYEAADPSARRRLDELADAMTAILLATREALRARAAAHGVWTLPGGVVETGETLAEAVAREVREETSLAIEPVALAGYREFIVRDVAQRVERHFVILAFAARWLAGEPSLNEE